MAYPNTNLSTDTLDPPYGGAPANRWGTPARQFVDAVLQFLGQAYLNYLRVPWNTWVTQVSAGVAVGDVAVLAESPFVSSSGYYVCNYSTAVANSYTYQVIGVFLDAASTGAKARIAIGGVIPPSVTGLGVLAAQNHISVNPATGRLRAAVNGDTIIGYSDIQGNVLLLSPGRLI